MAKKVRHRYSQKRRPKWFFRFGLSLLLITGFTVIGLVFFNPWVWKLDLRSELEKSKIATTLYDRNGEPIAGLFPTTRLWVPLRDIPEDLQKAVIITEDKRFYQHKGIDFRGILRAVYQDILAGRKVQGGSTITQQLVKNLFLSHEKRIIRKIFEMAYAIRIEQQYSKEQILEFYLNSIYFGHGAWGAQSAAEVYFGKPLRELTVSECALLTGLIKSPEYYSPFRNAERALERRNLVLNLMGNEGYLKREAVERLSQEPVNVLEQPGSTYVGAYFVDYVLSKLKQRTNFNEEYLRGAGLSIYTTMDRRVQSAAEEAIKSLPVSMTDQWGVVQPQGAIVVLKPTTGEILALVGGRRFSQAQVNRAFEIYRQPGSAIKPFLFAAALETGYRPETKMIDQPLEIMVNGRPWRPQNYDNRYRGEITLQTALEESVNTVAVQLVRELGPGNVYALAQRMGLENLVAEGEKNDLGPAPLALGGLTKGLSLLELTGAYTPFANQGIRSRPFGIFRVYDRAGKLIYQERISQETVISRETAFDLTSMMEGVILRGTGIRANIGIKAAGKTGTTNRNTNGWFIGYTPEYLAGVWIGNDRSDQPLSVKGIPLGSGAAASIWGGLLRGISADTAGVQPDWPWR
ncbi:MAG: PBP1A family penicillin-binding protein [Firmicutes bacterium]|nr:PBP1A family penicillin-binding protein [Bacillota bacterium]